MVLLVEHLKKHFGSFQALEDVSLNLAPGEVVGFLGPNGAGKSTTMKIITGFLAPDNGQVVIDGVNQADDPLACRRRIGYLPQEAPLYGDMRVESYLDHVARLKGYPPATRRAEVRRVMEAVDLPSQAKRHIHKLSGGMRQRVGVAQALIGSPPILILDEPTAGLDPAQVANFREILKDLSKKHSILLSTHIMGEVEACCHRVVVVHRGRIILSGDAAKLQELRARESRLRIRLLSGSAEAITEALRGISGVESVTNDGEDLLVLAPVTVRAEIIACVQNHGSLREIIEERRSLEEVFRDLIA